MAWLQKRPQTSEAVQFYTLGQNKTILLVGLGNPGSKYNLTRHNSGFMCLDYFVTKTDSLSDWIDKKDLHCVLSSGRLGDSQVIAIKPSSFMNLSGQAVQATANFYKIPPDRIVVVHDELEINFGQIRSRTGGSSAGHNGIKSISDLIGEDYGRIRVGIGPKTPDQIDSATFVLQQFSDQEKKQLPLLYREVNAILSEYIYGGQLTHETRNFLL
ncbi:MAG TPA: aminoacyl-tRNA hydrolase [Candidatus Dormibacteraeota bacterium]|nr:aminoacyl-tRNA hydrolase [Candidatus Dormibacteraeota bacterium]